jgi:APA family basic amino acid/polyamine antiporter
VKWGSRTQEITGLLKVLAFVVVIVACLVGSHGKTPAPSVAMPASLFVAFVLALQAVIYTYDGWAAVIYFSEEVRNKEKNIPRALFAGVFSIIAIYVGVNLALLYVLPVTAIAGKNLALATAAEAVFGRLGDPIVRALMVISMISGINAYHLMATRVIFAMSRDGVVTRRAAVVNKGGTPTVALALSAGVAILFILSGTFEQVIAVLAFFFVANYTLSFISLFVMRKREPDAVRPYRVRGYPFTPAIALIGSIAFLVGAVAGDTRRSVYALLLLAVSWPVYRFSKSRVEN